MKNMDLHMHTNKSDDGEFAPALLMQMCKDAGLDVVAIADHNTTQGISEAYKAAKQLGLEYIPAIEIDCTINDTNLHILGYGIDETDQLLIQHAEFMATQGRQSSSKQIQLCKELGLHIDENACYALSRDGAVTGEIVAEVALQDPCNYTFLKDYLPGGSRSDNPYVNFYWDHCSQGKPAYVPMEFITLKQAVDIIHHAKGIAVLAHPGNNTKEDQTLLDDIFAYDVIGMEVYSSYHTPQQIKFYLEYAKAHNLIITTGSDFHGKTKPSIMLGESGCKDSSIYYPAFLQALQNKKEIS